MDRSRDTSRSRFGTAHDVRTGMVGLGLCLLGGVAVAGCGIGTDPSFLQGTRDAAGPVDGATGGPGADASSTTPGGIPPIDQTTWADTAIATFALG